MESVYIGCLKKRIVTELRSEFSDLSDDNNSVNKTYESCILEGESSSDIQFVLATRNTCEPHFAVQIPSFRLKKILQVLAGVFLKVDTMVLDDGIIQSVLFNVWKEEQDPKEKANVVLSLVRNKTDFDKYEDKQ
ncbi:hypothetical protein TNCV_2459691 [Trichonephila clavipes]|nr:hypothetical protein TNCV_2459691 [Trichonephila clavipes]